MNNVSSFRRRAENCRDSQKAIIAAANAAPEAKVAAEEKEWQRQRQKRSVAAADAAGAVRVLLRQQRRQAEAGTGTASNYLVSLHARIFALCIACKLPYISSVQK